MVSNWYMYIYICICIVQYASVYTLVSHLLYITGWVLIDCLLIAYAHDTGPDPGTAAMARPCHRLGSCHGHEQWTGNQQPSDGQYAIGNTIEHTYFILQYILPIASCHSKGPWRPAVARTPGPPGIPSFPCESTCPTDMPSHGKVVPFTNAWGAAWRAVTQSLASRPSVACSAMKHSRSRLGLTFRLPMGYHWPIGLMNRSKKVRAEDFQISIAHASNQYSHKFTLPQTAFQVGFSKSFAPNRTLEIQALILLIEFISLFSLAPAGWLDLIWSVAHCSSSLPVAFGKGPRRCQIGCLHFEQNSWGGYCRANKTFVWSDLGLVNITVTVGLAPFPG